MIQHDTNRRSTQARASPVIALSSHVKGEKEGGIVGQTTSAHHSEYYDWKGYALLMKLAPTLTAITFARLVINSLRRFPYVVLTPLTIAFGLPREYFEYAIALQLVVSLLASLLSSTFERFSKKHLMLVALSVFSALCGIGYVVSPLQGGGYVVLALLVLGGLCKVVFDPAMQAYIGDSTPYERRGMAIGITELAWAGSGLVFGRMAAQFMDVGNNSAASAGMIFGVIGICGVVAVAVLWRVVPYDAPKSLTRHGRINLAAAWLQVRSTPAALVLLVAGAGAMFSAEAMAIGYERWFRDTFAMSTASIGNLAVLLSIAEVAGEGVIILAADRLGKRRLMLVALVVCSLSCWILPLLSGALPAAATALIIQFFAFEIAIITIVSISTEVIPQARASMMSMLTVAFGGGRALGTLVGGRLLENLGYIACGLVALTICGVAAFLAWRYVREFNTDEQSAAAHPTLPAVE